MFRLLRKWFRKLRRVRREDKVSKVRHKRHGFKSPDTKKIKRTSSGEQLSESGCIILDSKEREGGGRFGIWRKKQIIELLKEYDEEEKAIQTAILKENTGQ